MAKDIFISYSTKDEAHVQTLRSVLDANSISYWIAPRDIPGGSNYAREIPSAIRNCTVFLLVLSQNAESSIWVSRELDLAVNSRKVILPLMVEDFAVGDEFNFLLTGCQRYEAFRRKSEVLETMIARIRSILCVEGNPSAPTAPTVSTAPTASTASTSPIASQPALVRFDGIYHSDAFTSDLCYFLRFFPDGTVLYTRHKKVSPVSGTTNMSTWFNKNFPIQISCNIFSNPIQLPFPCEKYPHMQMHATVKSPKQIELSISWTKGKNERPITMTFVPVKFSEKQGNVPRKAIYDTIFWPFSDLPKPQPAPSKPTPAPKSTTPVISAPPAKTQKVENAPQKTVTASPMPEKNVHKLPFAPTPAEIWSRKKHELIRTDGIYQSQLKNGAYRYLRFSPLNYKQVFHVYSPCLPCEVMRWFNFAGVQEGVCAYSRTDVHLNIASSMIFMGSVEQNKLSLRSYFADSNEEDEYLFTFIPFPESSRQPDNILGFGDDPMYRFKLLFAGNPQPRYDGYYCSDEPGEGKTYLRFYPTGEVYETFHVGPAQGAMPKLKAASRNGGIRFQTKYSLNRSIINFSFQHPMYKSIIRYRGKITEDRLLMEVHYSTFNSTVAQTYTFHKVSSEFF